MFCKGLVCVFFVFYRYRLYFELYGGILFLVSCIIVMIDGFFLIFYCYSRGKLWIVVNVNNLIIMLIIIMLIIIM